ncbi:hypothetical protein FVE85_7416 [Porphyridium purpureum]|uniref:Uncharacterized protein n=1 Tax=Porphyridium purpureum TaxID=35688 RepID=A0A5J4Z7B5_PORPP|nr:hypothetical protein FVE85_7416 [Porphyridium purpureum]|eukprot:POR9798..scf295_1
MEMSRKLSHAQGQATGKRVRLLGALDDADSNLETRVKRMHFWDDDDDTEKMLGIGPASQNARTPTAAGADGQGHALQQQQQEEDVCPCLCKPPCDRIQSTGHLQANADVNWRPPGHRRLVTSDSEPLATCLRTQVPEQHHHHGQQHEEGQHYDLNDHATCLQSKPTSASCSHAQMWPGVRPLEHLVTEYYASMNAMLHQLHTERQARR